LWGVALEDLFDELIVLLSELEWDIRIILWGVSVLIEDVSKVKQCTRRIELSG
jgi:hypothetical protein